MKFVIQVCSQASVEVEDKTVGKIGRGASVLVGIGADDTKEIADKMLSKLLSLRIFPDDAGKTNLSIRDICGSLLIISQFTLYANVKHGNRPGFTEAGKPDMANALYEYIISKSIEAGIHTEHGIFGADMRVRLVNEGPFTIVMDSGELGM